MADAPARLLLWTRLTRSMSQRQHVAHFAHRSQTQSDLHPQNTMTTATPKAKGIAGFARFYGGGW